jgi:3-oxoadipate enol-lactonase
MPVLNANGETIHYERFGSGPAVVLIHSLGASAQMWKPQVAALEGYSAIAIDCRGHGRSSANGRARAADAVADLKALLDHLDVVQCHLVGIGMGAAVALLFNAEFPSMPRSLVLAGFSAKPPPGSADHVAATREALAYISMQEFGTQYAAQHLMFTTPLEVQDEIADGIAKMDPKVYIDSMQSTLPEDFTPLVAQVEVPTLVIAGANDSAIPLASAEYLAGSIAKAVLKVIPDAAHMSNLDNAAEFNSHLCEFLRTQS